MVEVATPQKAYSLLLILYSGKTIMFQSGTPASYSIEYSKIFDNKIQIKFRVIFLYSKKVSRTEIVF